MQRHSVSPVQNIDTSQGAVNAVLSTFTANTHLRLFTAGPGTITPNNVVSDFTQATFVGYAQKVVAAGDWTGSALSDNGNAVMLAYSAQWIAGSIVPPGQIILGYYLIDSTDALLYLAEIFAVPVPISAPFQVLDLDIYLPLNMLGALS